MSRPHFPLPDVRRWSDAGQMSNETTDIPVYLCAASKGVWWVHTASGAVHIWDMDNQTVTRARPDDDNGLRWDGSAIPIVHVAEYPRVGAGFGVVLDSPGVAGCVTIRTSSDVVSIQRPPR